MIKDLITVPPGSRYAGGTVILVESSFVTVQFSLGKTVIFTKSSFVTVSIALAE